MGDLLKEAIADAKAVRETALANAKMALEEAFTPQLKSMLSAKLKEDEFEDEEVPFEDEMGGEEELGLEPEIPAEEPVVAPEEGAYEDEIPGEEIPGEEPVAAVPEVPGVPGEEEDALDLEAIIRELEQELAGGHGMYEQDDAYDKNVGKTDSSHLAEQDDAYDQADPGEKSEHVGGSMDGVPALKKEGEEHDDDDDVEIDESLFKEGEDDDEDKEAVDENNDVSSNIGTGDNVQPATKANDDSTEDPGDSTEVKDMDGVAALKKENKEYKEAVQFLKDKLHEVNILNAKLLFTNKLFKSFSLNNNQKLKVVETFDRAQTTREIKLVYSTLAEQFGDNNTIARKKSITESASSAVGSTKPSKESRKVITEESQVANRFRKLAGLSK